MRTRDRERLAQLTNDFLRPFYNARFLTMVKARWPATPSLKWMTDCIVVENGQRIFKVLMTDEKRPNDFFTVELPVADDCTPLEFLRAVMHHKGVPLAMRLDAGKNAAYYVHPRLMALKTVSDDGRLLLDVQGGLPALPGTQTMMPGPDGVTPTIIEGNVVKAVRKKKFKRKHKQQPSDEAKK